MKDSICQLKNENLIHDTILDNCTEADFSCSLAVFHLTRC